MIKIEMYYHKIKNPDFDKNEYFEEENIYFTTHFYRQRCLLKLDTIRDKMIDKIKETEIWKNRENIPYEDEVETKMEKDNSFDYFSIYVDITEEELFYLKLKYDFNLT